MLIHGTINDSVENRQSMGTPHYAKANLPLRSRMERITAQISTKKHTQKQRSLLRSVHCKNPTALLLNRFTDRRKVTPLHTKTNLIEPENGHDSKSLVNTSKELLLQNLHRYNRTISLATNKSGNKLPGAKPNLAKPKRRETLVPFHRHNGKFFHNTAKLFFIIRSHADESAKQKQHKNDPAQSKQL